MKVNTVLHILVTLFSIFFPTQTRARQRNDRLVVGEIKIHFQIRQPYGIPILQEQIQMSICPIPSPDQSNLFTLNNNDLVLTSRSRVYTV